MVYLRVQKIVFTYELSWTRCKQKPWIPKYSLGESRHSLRAVGERKRSTQSTKRDSKEREREEHNKNGNSNRPWWFKSIGESQVWGKPGFNRSSKTNNSGYDDTAWHPHRDSMGTSIPYFHPHEVGREQPETDTGYDVTHQMDLTLIYRPFYPVINYPVHMLLSSPWDFLWNTALMG